MVPMIVMIFLGKEKLKWVEIIRLYSVSKSYLSLSLTIIPPIVKNFDKPLTPLSSKKR